MKAKMLDNKHLTFYGERFGKQGEQQKPTQNVLAIMGYLLVKDVDGLRRVVRRKQ